MLVIHSYNNSNTINKTTPTSKRSDICKINHIWSAIVGSSWGRGLSPK